MGARKRFFNIGRIRKGATYSLQEVADLCDVHIRTVQEWRKEGLKIIDKHKPYLMHGSDLYGFLKHRQEKRKSKCKQNQLYCFSCKAPREPNCNGVNLIILNHKQLRIIGCCDSCGTTINKFGSTKNLEHLKQVFNVKQIQDQRL